METMIRIIVAVVIVTLGIIMGELASYSILKMEPKDLTEYKNRPKEPHKISLIYLGWLAKYLIITMSIVILLVYMGVQITPLVALATSIMFGLMFALQGTLSSLFSGLMITLFSDYSIGDLISVDDKMGFITDIGIIKTVLKDSALGYKINISNETLYKSNVVNFSKYKEVAFEFIINVRYTNNVKFILNVINDAAKKNKWVIVDPSIPSPQVYVNTFQDGTYQVACKTWVKPENYFNLTASVQTDVMKALQKHNIEFTGSLKVR